MAGIRMYGPLSLLPKGVDPDRFVGRRKLRFRLTFTIVDHRRSIWGSYRIKDGIVVEGHFDRKPIADPEREYGMPYSLMRALRWLSVDLGCEIMLAANGRWITENVYESAVRITLHGIQPIRRTTKLLEAVGRKLTRYTEDAADQLAGASIECI